MLFSTDMAQLALISASAASFATENNLVDLEPGRYELGDGDYVNIIEYTSKRRCDGAYESHCDYVDIQAILDGREIIEVAPAYALETTSAYDDANDCALYDGSYKGEQFLLESGRFCLVMPEDAHMPGIAVDDEPAAVKKAVFKILVDHLAAAN